MAVVMHHIEKVYNGKIAKSSIEIQFRRKANRFRDSCFGSGRVEYRERADRPSSLCFHRAIELESVGANH